METKVENSLDKLLNKIKSTNELIRRTLYSLTETCIRGYCWFYNKINSLNKRLNNLYEKLQKRGLNGIFTKLLMKLAILIIGLITRMLRNINIVAEEVEIIMDSNYDLSKEKSKSDDIKYFDWTNVSYNNEINFGDTAYDFKKVNTDVYDCSVYFDNLNNPKILQKKSIYKDKDIKTLRKYGKYKFLENLVESIFNYREGKIKSDDNVDFNKKENLGKERYHIVFFDNIAVVYEYKRNYKKYTCCIRLNDCHNEFDTYKAKLINKKDSDYFDLISYNDIEEEINEIRRKNIRSRKLDFISNIFSLFKETIKIILSVISIYILYKTCKSVVIEVVKNSITSIA